MSLDATRWAWEQAEIKATEKLVLLSLADRADENHTCYPSVDRLADDTCLNRKTIMAAISALESAGLIAVDRVFGAANKYQLIGVVDRHTTSTKNGTGSSGKSKGSTNTRFGTAFRKGTSTEIGTGEPEQTSTSFGTSTEFGTSTKNGTRPVPKTVLEPVPNLGHEPTTEPTKNLFTAGAAVSTASFQSPISNWIPRPDSITALVTIHGVPRQFVDEQLPEFRAYWHDRNLPATSWDSKFIQRVGREWKTTGHAWKPAPQSAHGDTYDQLNDTSWYDGKPAPDLKLISGDGS